MAKKSDLGRRMRSALDKGEGRETGCGGIKVITFAYVEHKFNLNQEQRSHWEVGDAGRSARYATCLGGDVPTELPTSTCAPANSPVRYPIHSEVS